MHARLAHQPTPQTSTGPGSPGRLRTPPATPSAVVNARIPLMPWSRLPAPSRPTQTPQPPVDAIFCLQAVAFGWLAVAVAGWLRRRWPWGGRGGGGSWDEPLAVALWPASGVRGAGPPPRIRRVTARQIL
eukprot:EG_transcript_48364